MLQLFLAVLVATLATAIVLGKPGSWKKPAAIGLLICLLALIAPALSYWLAFGKVDTALKDAGLADDHLRKAAAAFLAFLLIAIVPAVIGALVKSRRWLSALAVSVGIYCGFQLLLFVIARPSPDKQADPKPAPRSALAPAPAHDFWVDNVHFSFDSCTAIGTDLRCSLTTTNDDKDDRTMTWKHDVLATDALGNIHYAAQRDVGGYWATDSFLGFNTHVCEDCDLAQNVIGHVRTTFHAKFEGVPESVTVLQNLRLTVCCTGLFNREINLDFVNLPVVREAIAETGKATITGQSDVDAEVTDRKPESDVSVDNSQPSTPTVTWVLRAGDNVHPVSAIMQKDKMEAGVAEKPKRRAEEALATSPANGTTGSEMVARPKEERATSPSQLIPAANVEPKGSAPWEPVLRQKSLAQPLVAPEPATPLIEDRPSLRSRVSAACGEEPTPQAPAIAHSDWLWCRFEVFRTASTRPNLNRK